MNIFDTLFNHAMFTFFFLQVNHFLLYYTSFVCLCVDYKYKKIMQPTLDHCRNRARKTWKKNKSEQ